MSCRGIGALALLGAGLGAPVPPGAAPAAVPLATLTAPDQANYMLHCMGCHAADGSGAPPKVPSVRGSLLPLASRAAGRRYLVQVPGAAQSTLSNLELAQVLTWMVRNLSAQPVPGQIAEFSESEVAAYRRTPLIDARAARARLL